MARAVFKSLMALVNDPAFINCDMDPVALLKGIRTAKLARLCLFGPPGTGKTAYARWIAQQLDCPIHIKRASDLLSQYVGQTEKNIAAAFCEADEVGAVLLMDEVDSFLQDRGKAQRSWEVTQVNEFLTQMELFEGVFIASTNLMEGLDQAALRRFDMKAKFDYLRPEQACSYLARVTMSPVSHKDFQKLASLPALALGDFAAVERQNRFYPLDNAEAWVAALEKECTAKLGVPRQIIGFGSQLSLVCKQSVFTSFPPS